MKEEAAYLLFCEHQRVTWGSLEGYSILGPSLVICRGWRRGRGVSHHFFLGSRFLHLQMSRLVTAQGTVHPGHPRAGLTLNHVHCSFPEQCLHGKMSIFGSKVWPRWSAFHYKLTYSVFPYNFLPSLLFYRSLIAFPPSFSVQLAFLPHARAYERSWRYSNGWVRAPRGVCRSAMMKESRGCCRNITKGFLHSAKRT